MQTTRLPYTVLLASLFFSTTLSAQVFNSGPSDPTLFTNVFNLPGDDFPDSGSVKGVDGETTQINVADAIGTSFEFGNSFDAFDGVEVNITGGSVGSLEGLDGSEINISGGSLGRRLDARQGSVVNISGGTVNDFFFTDEGSEVNFSGGSLDGRLVARGTVNVRGGSLGSVDTFESSVLNISGGALDGGFQARGSEVNITGGSVGGGPVVGVGAVGVFTFALDGSVVNISGGTVGENFNTADSVVNISGGSIGSRIRVGSGTTFNLFGSNFVLDGESLDDLVVGDAFTIENRDVTISGILDDGSSFSFNFSDDPISFPDNFFASDATLTVTLTSVPEPTSNSILLLGCGLAGMRRRRSAA